MRIVDESVRFMPPSLRLALENRRETMMRGMLVPLVEGPAAERRPPWRDGELDAATARASRHLVATVQGDGTFDDIARAFGELALLVTEASWPPAMAEAADLPRRDHFAEFCQDRLERFPLVFYGHDDDELSRGNFAGFSRRLMEQARREDGNLAAAYGRAGTPPDPSHFDDRSIPFAVGSLAYSRSVTYLVRAWLTAWEMAGGDVAGVPYRTASADGEAPHPRREPTPTP